MYCGKCGAKVKDGCLFCTECGQRLRTPAAPQNHSPQSEETTKEVAPTPKPVPTAEPTPAPIAEPVPAPKPAPAPEVKPPLQKNPQSTPVAQTPPQQSSASHNPATPSKAQPPVKSEPVKKSPPLPPPPAKEKPSGAKKGRGGLIAAVIILSLLLFLGAGGFVYYMQQNMDRASESSDAMANLESQMANEISQREEIISSLQAELDSAKADKEDESETPEETPPATTAPIEENPTETHDPVTLTFWQAGGDTVTASSVMRLLLDKFEMMYPWITVDYRTIPWSQDPYTQFQTAIAGGNCADVLVLGSPLDFQLSGEDNLLPLDDLVDPAVLADIPDILENNGRYYGNTNPDMNGKLMSLPLYAGTRALLYNKEIFDYFGVDYPTEGMSHADLLEMAKKVTGDMYGTKVYGFGTRATTSEQYLNFVWNYGGKLVDPATMTPGTSSAEWKQGIQDYLAFYEAGVVPEGAASMSGTELLSMFVNGECAMFVAAVDYADAILQEEVPEGQAPWSEKLAVAPLVGETYATCYAGADVLAVPATTRNSYEAGLLVSYLMSAEAQAAYCKNVGFFPASASAARDPYFMDDPIRAGFAATAAGGHFFDNYGVPGVGTILKEEIQRLIAGEITIDQYQDNITTRIQKNIIEYGV